MEHPASGVYVLFSQKDFLFYMGYIGNFERRMKEHAEGKSLSTAPGRPFLVLLCEYYFAREYAFRRELYFKTSPDKKTLRLMLQQSLKKAFESTLIQFLFLAVK